MEVIGASELAWLLADRLRHEAEVKSEKKTVVSDHGIQSLLTAGARQMQSQSTDLQVLMSIASAVFQFLIHPNISIDTLRACEHRTKAFDSTLDHTIRRCNPNELGKYTGTVVGMYNSMEELNVRVPGRVDRRTNCPAMIVPRLPQT